MAFTYPCPDCQSGHSFHEAGCGLDEFAMSEIERTYIDIISRLTGREEPWSYSELREAINEMGEDADNDVVFESTSGGTDSAMDHPGWTPLHDSCLHYLKNVGRAYEGEDGIEPSEPGEHQQGVVPKNDPLRTVFEYGPIDGCKDYAVYTMVSWCELINLDWDQTRAFIDYWLTTTDRWETEDWGESSPVELAEDKKHIHDKGMGWGEYPEMAKAEMETSSEERRLDANEVAASIDRELLDSMNV